MRRKQRLVLVANLMRWGIRLRRRHCSQVRSAIDLKPCFEALTKWNQAKDPHNERWSSDVEGFWHKGSRSWSANTRIPGIENRVISPEPPTHWKPLTAEEEKY